MYSYTYVSVFECMCVCVYESVSMYVCMCGSLRVYDFTLFSNFFMSVYIAFEYLVSVIVRFYVGF